MVAFKKKYYKNKIELYRRFYDIQMRHNKVHCDNGFSNNKLIDLTRPTCIYPECYKYCVTDNEDSIIKKLYCEEHVLIVKKLSLNEIESLKMDVNKRTHVSEIEDNSCVLFKKILKLFI